MTADITGIITLADKIKSLNVVRSVLSAEFHLRLDDVIGAFH